MKLTRIVVAGMLALVAGGCSHGASANRPASRLTEAQRDSAIARSSLPGARTVGKALELSGQGASRAAQLDSLSH